MIRLIASDIDGTLVPDGTDRIDPRMMDVIRRLKEKGILFAGASGRQFLSMKKLFNPVWQDMYYITDNGSILRNADRVLVKHVIPRNVLMEMIRDAKMLPDCDIMLCGENAAYCEEYSEMFYWLRDSYKFNVRVLGDFEMNLTDEIVKMSIYQKDHAEETVNRWFTPKWESRFNIASAGTMWMDIVEPDADKGSSLRELQKLLGIGPEETMVFGDNLNDLGMLRSAEESYAIGSARDEVKKEAKHVAPPLSENGETEVLLKLLETL
ncbi:MAG: HAD family hydrolase [Eubacterium sp.]|nr:HAD family hydrolase [Eubacterium sp.]MBR6171855.1 HAD family hydrolase [Eubacterium sp.]